MACVIVPILYHTIVHRVYYAALYLAPKCVTSAVLNGVKGQLTLGFHCDVSQQCCSRYESCLFRDACHHKLWHILLTCVSAFLCVGEWLNDPKLLSLFLHLLWVGHQILSLKLKARCKESYTGLGIMGGWFRLTEPLDVVSKTKYESAVISDKMCPCSLLTPFLFQYYMG